MTKIKNAINKINTNVSDLNVKKTNVEYFNTNHDYWKQSRIIANSGWYSIKASVPYDLQRSADSTKNNILIAAYYFKFPNITLSENQLKDIDFIIESKKHPSLTTKSVCSWSSTEYTITSDGYTVYGPALAWKGGVPGTFLASDSVTAPYKKDAWFCSYTYQSSPFSGILRYIGTTDTYVDGDGHTHNIYYRMTYFTAVDSSSATGGGYVWDYDTFTSSYDLQAYNPNFTLTYSDYSEVTGSILLQGGIGYNFNLYPSSDPAYASGFTAQTTSVGGETYQVAYYDEHYIWQIAYSFSSSRLINLPIGGGIGDHDVPSNIYVTRNANPIITSTDNILYSGVTPSGQSFSYVKVSDKNYELRIVGSVVFQSLSSIGDLNTYNTQQENYALSDDAWSYDNTEIISSLDTPYYLPLETDVQIRCLVNYLSKTEYNSFKS